MAPRQPASRGRLAGGAGRPPDASAPDFGESWGIMRICLVRQPEMPRAAYVYCIVRSARKPSVARVPAGLPGAGPPTVDRLADAIWMVTASVPLETYASDQLEPRLRDLQWVGRIAMAHEAVVEYFVRRRGTAVIPMKLFTMFSSSERAGIEMRRRRREIEQVFGRIEGCEEWGVRITRAELPPAPRPTSTSGPRTGVAFLASRKQARDDARRAAAQAAEAADRAFESLSSVAREGRRRSEDAAGVTAPLLDAAFLVATRRRTKFHGLAKRLAREVGGRGARMTVTGPWPVYNFISEPGPAA